jgi:hypothetical protein
MMLKVTVDLETSGGNETLATLDIINQQPDNIQIANYVAILTTKEGKYTADIENFERKQGALALVRRALDEVS